MGNGSRPSDAAMRLPWQGALGAVWADAVETMERQLAPVGAIARAGLAAEPGERVLDVGSGGGVDTAAIAAAVGASGRVLAVDVSPDLAEIARARLAGQPQAEVILADGATHPFEAGAFDALYSRLGVMFFDEPVAAFVNLRRAIRPGGRVAITVFAGLEHNPWALVPFEVGRERLALTPPQPGGHGPFGWSDPAYVTPILETAGFSAVTWETQEAALPVGAGFAPDPVDAAVGLSLRIGSLARAMNALDQAARAEAVAALAPRLAEAFAPHVRDGVVTLAARLWVIRATA